MITNIRALIMQTKSEYVFPVSSLSPIRTDSPAHQRRLKHAVDFIVPEGTSIFAAADGVVVDVKQDSDKGGSTEEFDEEGNYIEIKHVNNEYSIYEHLKQNGSLVKIGDSVKEGQVIGYSGSTGWLAHLGPHLHFDVHVYFGEGREDYETLEIRWKK